MHYLHTMIRVTDLETSLQFYCNVLGMKEISRKESENGRFTLIFLAAPGDLEGAKDDKAPMLELTYNWPAEDGNVEQYTSGRNFGHVAFRVDDIYETCQNILDQGVIINRPPRDGYMAFIKSPDGISIELLQSGEALKPQEPWVSMKSTGSW